MKKFLALFGVMLAITINAQTNTPPSPPPLEAVAGTNVVPSLPEYVTTWLNFLGTTSTNWVVAPYAIYVDDDVNSFGGGIAAMYSVSQYALTGLRLDYVNGELWMPSVNLTLQLPLKVADKVTVAPFAISGLATPLGGRGDDNGEAVGILGGGLAVRVTKNLGVVYDAEMWSRFSGTQHRFGLYWRF